MASNTFTKPSEPPRDLWGLIGLAGAIFCLTGLIIGMILTWPSLVSFRHDAAAHDPLQGLSQTLFTAETGLRLIRVSSTAGGGMIDMRYRVVDPDKAVIVHDTKTPPALMNEATGRIVDRPFHDHSSKSQLKAGVIYNEILVNEGGVIRPGDLVTVRVGAARLEHVPVQ